MQFRAILCRILNPTNVYLREAPYRRVLNNTACTLETDPNSFACKTTNSTVNFNRSWYIPSWKNRTQFGKWEGRLSNSCFRIALCVLMCHCKHLNAKLCYPFLRRYKIKHLVPLQCFLSKARVSRFGLQIQWPFISLAKWLNSRSVHYLGKA